jgi:hypothetical protein
MMTPQLNPDGYTHSAVNDMTGFENTNYLLVHGTGDDNGKETHNYISSGTIQYILIFLLCSSLSKFCSLGG